MSIPQMLPIPDFPEILALRAFGFISRDKTELARFLDRADLHPGEVRTMPIRREVLAAALDFLVKDEEILVKFARTLDLPLEAAYEARRQLDG